MHWSSLHGAGYSETRFAYSGEAALAIAADFQPSVVLLDLSLLDMTGYDLAGSRTPAITVRGDIAEGLQPPDVSTAVLKNLQPIIAGLPAVTASRRAVP